MSYEKSEFFHSPNLDDIYVSVLKTYVDMKCVVSHSRYLGMPILMQSKRETFREVEERMEKRLHDWKFLTLSSAGKEVLIKACVQAIPLYIMSCYKLPKTVCNTMTAGAISYWWSKGKKERSFHWSMGFRCFDSMNKAMLMKQLWRISKYPELLVSQILKDKYGRGGNLLHSISKPSDSAIWKSLCGISDIFKAGEHQMETIFFG